MLASYEAELALSSNVCCNFNLHVMQNEFRPTLTTFDISEFYVTFPFSGEESTFGAARKGIEIINRC